MRREKSMVIKNYTSTNETLKEMGKRIKRLRFYNKLTQADLSKQSGVSIRTITNMESGKDVAFSSFIAVIRTLNALQELNLVLSDGAVAMDIIGSTGKERQRVKEGKNNKIATSWKWGDER